METAQQERDRAEQAISSQLQLRTDEVGSGPCSDGQLEAARQELASLSDFGRQRASIERRLLEMKV